MKIRSAIMLSWIFTLSTSFAVAGPCIETFKGDLSGAGEVGLMVDDWIGDDLMDELDVGGDLLPEDKALVNSICLILVE